MTGLLDFLMLPLSAAKATLNVVTGKEPVSSAVQRLGLSLDSTRSKGPVIWFHASHIGECSVALPILFRCLQEYNEKVGLLLTTASLEAYNMLKETLPERITVQLVPMDNPLCIGMFLSAWKPQVLVLMNSPLCTQLVLVAARHNLKLALINASINGDQVLHWHSNKARREAMSQLLSKFDLLVPLSDTDFGHFCLFGAEMKQMPGWCADLQQAAALASGAWHLSKPLLDDTSLLRHEFSGRPTWAAVHTQPGEEKLVARVHIQLTSQGISMLRTIIAPANSDRCSKLAKLLLEEMGLSVDLWQGPRGKYSSDLLLIDDLSQLNLLYDACETVLVGSSMIDKSDLIEAAGGSGAAAAATSSGLLAGPAVAGCALIVGPYIGGHNSNGGSPNMAEELNLAALAASEEACAVVRRAGSPLEDMAPLDDVSSGDNQQSDVGVLSNHQHGLREMSSLQGQDGRGRSTPTTPIPRLFDAMSTRRIASASRLRRTHLGRFSPHNSVDRSPYSEDLVSVHEDVTAQSEHLPFTSPTQHEQSLHTESVTASSTTSSITSSFSPSRSYWGVTLGRWTPGRRGPVQSARMDRPNSVADFWSPRRRRNNIYDSPSQQLMLDAILASSACKQAIAQEKQELELQEVEATSLKGSPSFQVDGGSGSAGNADNGEPLPADAETYHGLSNGFVSRWESYKFAVPPQPIATLVSKLQDEDSLDSHASLPAPLMSHLPQEDSGGAPGASTVDCRLLSSKGSISMPKDVGKTRKFSPDSSNSRLMPKLSSMGRPRALSWADDREDATCLPGPLAMVKAAEEGDVIRRTSLIGNYIPSAQGGPGPQPVSSGMRSVSFGFDTREGPLPSAFNDSVTLNWQQTNETPRRFSYRQSFANWLDDTSPGSNPDSPSRSPSSVPRDQHHIMQHLMSTLVPNDSVGGSFLGSPKGSRLGPRRTDSSSTSVSPSSSAVHAVDAQPDQQQEMAPEPAKDTSDNLLEPDPLSDEEGAMTIEKMPPPDVKSSGSLSSVSLVRDSLASVGTQIGDVSSGDSLGNMREASLAYLSKPISISKPPQRRWMPLNSSGDLISEIEASDLSEPEPSPSLDVLPLTNRGARRVSYSSYINTTSRPRPRRRSALELPFRDFDNAPDGSHAKANNANESGVFGSAWNLVDAGLDMANKILNEVTNDRSDNRIAQRLHKAPGVQDLAPSISPEELLATRSLPQRDLLRMVHEAGGTDQYASPGRGRKYKTTQQPPESPRMGHRFSAPNFVFEVNSNNSECDMDDEIPDTPTSKVDCRSPFADSVIDRPCPFSLTRTGSVATSVPQLIHDQATTSSSTTLPWGDSMRREEETVIPDTPTSRMSGSSPFAGSVHDRPCPFKLSRNGSCIDSLPSSAITGNYLTSTASNDVHAQRLGMQSVVNTRKLSHNQGTISSCNSPEGPRRRSTSGRQIAREMNNQDDPNPWSVMSKTLSPVRAPRSFGAPSRSAPQQAPASDLNVFGLSSLRSPRPNHSSVSRGSRGSSTDRLNEVVQSEEDLSSAWPVPQADHIPETPTSRVDPTSPFAGSVHDRPCPFRQSVGSSDSSNLTVLTGATSNATSLLTASAVAMINQGDKEGGTSGARHRGLEEWTEVQASLGQESSFGSSVLLNGQDASQGPEHHQSDAVLEASASECGSVSRHSIQTSQVTTPNYLQHELMALKPVLTGNPKQPSPGTPGRQGPRFLSKSISAASPRRAPPSGHGSPVRRRSFLATGAPASRFYYQATQIESNLIAGAADRQSVSESGDKSPKSPESKSSQSPNSISRSVSVPCNSMLQYLQSLAADCPVEDDQGLRVASPPPSQPRHSLDLDVDRDSERSSLLDASMKDQQQSEGEPASPPRSAQLSVSMSTPGTVNGLPRKPSKHLAATSPTRAPSESVQHEIPSSPKKAAAPPSMCLQEQRSSVSPSHSILCTPRGDKKAYPQSPTSAMPSPRPGFSGYASDTSLATPGGSNTPQSRCHELIADAVANAAMATLSPKVRSKLSPTGLSAVLGEARAAAMAAAEDVSSRCGSPQSSHINSTASGMHFFPNSSPYTSGYPVSGANSPYPSNGYGMSVQVSPGSTYKSPCRKLFTEDSGALSSATANPPRSSHIENVRVHPNVAASPRSPCRRLFSDNGEPCGASNGGSINGSQNMMSPRAHRDPYASPGPQGAQALRTSVASSPFRALFPTESTSKSFTSLPNSSPFKALIEDIPCRPSRSANSPSHAKSSVGGGGLPGPSGVNTSSPYSALISSTSGAGPSRASTSHSLTPGSPAGLEGLEHLTTKMLKLPNTPSRARSTQATNAGASVASQEPSVQVDGIYLHDVAHATNHKPVYDYVPSTMVSGLKVGQVASLQGGAYVDANPSLANELMDIKMQLKNVQSLLSEREAAVLSPPPPQPVMPESVKEEISGLRQQLEAMTLMMQQQQEMMRQMQQQLLHQQQHPHSPPSPTPAILQREGSRSPHRTNGHVRVSELAPRRSRTQRRRSNQSRPERAETSMVSRQSSDTFDQLLQETTADGSVEHQSIRETGTHHFSETECDESQDGTPRGRLLASTFCTRSDGQPASPPAPVKPISEATVNGLQDQLQQQQQQQQQQPKPQIPNVVAPSVAPSSNLPEISKLPPSSSQHGEVTTGTKSTPALLATSVPPALATHRLGPDPMLLLHGYPTSSSMSRGLNNHLDSPSGNGSMSQSLSSTPDRRWQPGNYTVPVSHLARGATGPAVWNVRDENELVDAVSLLLRDRIERRSRGVAASQAAAKMSSSLVGTVWGVLDEVVVTPALQEYVGKQLQPPS